MNRRCLARDSNDTRKEHMIRSSAHQPLGHCVSLANDGYDHSFLVCGLLDYYRYSCDDDNDADADDDDEDDDDDVDENDDDDDDDGDDDEDDDDENDDDDDQHMAQIPCEYVQMHAKKATDMF